MVKYERVSTPELSVGDVVNNSGARIRLVRELVRRPCGSGELGEGHCDPEHSHGELCAFLGEILNADDPECSADLLALARGGRPHRIRNNQWVPDGDRPLWTIQGNALAVWHREV